MTLQKINEILATGRRREMSRALYELENEIREGEKHFYIFGKKLEVSEWNDCFIHYEYNRDNEKYELYYNIEGTTKTGKYFYVKSTDAIAKHIDIR